MYKQNESKDEIKEDRADNQESNLEKNDNKETKKQKEQREWTEWRRAKKEGRLTEHRRMLRREANRNDPTRQR